MALDRHIDFLGVIIVDGANPRGPGGLVIMWYPVNTAAHR